MSRKKMTLGIFAAFVIIAIAIALLRPREITVVATPFTVEPIVRFGIDVERVGLLARYAASRYCESAVRNHVYVLGVFRGGNVLTGEEVTHKINADDLVAVLAETVIGGGIPESDNLSLGHEWSIYLFQNRHMHIILRGGYGMVNVQVRTFLGWRDVHEYNISDGSAIESILMRMIAEYEG